MPPRGPKEPTKAQLSSRLSYSQNTPAFLLRLQNKVAGTVTTDDEEPQYEDDEFEDYARGSGRRPIPKRPAEPRPAIPERPADDPGSADEDDLDEAPQVVVLKEGKHLTEREAENERRKAKGLPPLPDPGLKETGGEQDVSEVAGSESTRTTTEDKKKQEKSLSFSSGSKPNKGKRKAVELQSEDLHDKKNGGKSKSEKKQKKSKTERKTLLSFGDEA